MSGGVCPDGFFFWKGFCPEEFLSGRVMSGGIFCPRELCLGGLCPVTQLGTHNKFVPGPAHC